MEPKCELKEFDQDSKADLKEHTPAVLGNIETEKNISNIYDQPDKNKGGRRMKENIIRPHKCKQCANAFPTKSQLKYHVEIHSANELKCQQCSYTTKTTGCMHVHVKRMHMDKRIHHCIICAKDFVTLTELKLHAQIHMENRERSFQCQICSYSAHSEKALLSHAEKHLGTRFGCDKCEQSFSCKGTLRNHNRTKHDATFKIPVFSCSQCPKSYNSKGHLNRHIFSHAGFKPYKCDICEVNYASPNGFKSHMEEKHLNILPSHQCMNCPKIFYAKSQLKSHTYVHIDKRPFSCQECQTPFKSEKHLKTHKFTHTGAKSASCHICFVQFANKNKISRHMQFVHNDENKPECGICNEPFTHKDNLKVHIKTVHENIRNDKCHICTYAASSKSRLKRHLLFKHEANGKIESTCKQCDKVLKGPKSLEKHMRSVHTEHIKKCEICGNPFADLKRHIKRVHNATETLKLDLKSELKKKIDILSKVGEK